MSSIASSAQGSQEINNVNSTQNLQGSVSLYGRVFHKITGRGKYIIQSINKVAQSLLSRCICVMSFGRYNLDSLKSYLFSNQTVLKGDDALPTSFVPPPPPPPTPTSSSRLFAKVQSASFQESIASRAGSADVGSSVNPIQKFTQEDDPTLGDSTSFRRSSLHEDSDPVIEEERDANPNVNSQKNDIQKKTVAGGLFAGVQDSKLFQKIKKKVNSD
ncbi:hypothetical protein [Candidatus Rhabdochlamydia porcellionis]|jgi:hypothetical protein|uniref:Uncharacterized protein n=1 Tax=Candidatus Rhabdochlamydia porcellionis TaxID=225148 RepID=A0ABX8YYJ6_9BACT|nr:hypothetical protein [Candidatus Rhabdochlamydia porcellionis]QZA58396.1 hypothetical protein RHAB15C_0000269 [Candidatus Rhabdochlamydia porcellionis]